MLRRLVITGLVIAAAVAGASAAASAAAPRHHWVPASHPSWYWQLQGTINNKEPASIYDIDGFDTPATEVTRLHALGKHVICYIDVGTWENWRPDAKDFPKAVLGNSDGWPGERWLDIRKLKIIEPIMKRRFEMCARKHFDGLEPDNIDSQGNDPGFPITLTEQRHYAIWVAQTAHSLGLAVFQKNDPEQVGVLERYFDGVVSEQCNEYQECSSWQPYLKAGKPVLNAEYRKSLYPGFCKADKRAGIEGALFDLALDGRLFKPCWSVA
jgi:hypothetical protein